MITRVENFSRSLANGVQVFDVYVISSFEMTMKKYREVVGLLVPNLIDGVGRAYQGNTLLMQKGDLISADWALEVGLLPDVRDNVADTVLQMAMDLGLNRIRLEPHSIQLTVKHKRLFYGRVPLPVEFDSFFNPVINSLRLFCPVPEFFVESHEMQIALDPRSISVQSFNVDMPDKELFALNESLGWGMTEPSLKAVRKYFTGISRNPSDVELESIAQTWSEHCKHIIFSSPIDDIESGLYKHYLKNSTYEIMQRKPGFCISVFDDNAGAIALDDNWLVAAKVETHNTPSALEPFSGALTGILGVNRDIIGFGKGAKPIANSYGFCFAKLDSASSLYYSTNRPALSPRTIAKGVVRGVMVGGNCSGIPTLQGIVRFDDGYRAKPLVFVGSLGLLPAKIDGLPAHVKKPADGDRIVIIGGRTGRDGIHGANLSSMAASSKLSYTGVQAGDPITQKKLSDALINDLRDVNCYNAITDNGAGGLSSSVGEMGRAGFSVELGHLAVKHWGIKPWELWVSESQERMTLAVPESNIHKLQEVLRKHDVEMSIIGSFNTTGRAEVRYNSQLVLSLDTEFLHNGCPKVPLVSNRGLGEERCANEGNEDLLLERILCLPNFCSHRVIVEQYDHEVQGSSLLKPLQGIGKVDSPVTALRPVLSLNKAVAQAQSLAIIRDGLDPYICTWRAIERALMHLVAVGTNPDKIALIDNFCWSDPRSPRRLWQLKESVKACHDAALQFNAPFISGKDSMFNDFRGYDAHGNECYVSNIPTVLISAIGVIEDVSDCLSLDVKQQGDSLYLIGGYDIEGPSQSLSMLRKYYQAVQERLVASALGIDDGGVKYAIFKKLLAGGFGAEVAMPRISGVNGGFIVSIAPDNTSRFEMIMFGEQIHKLGSVVRGHNLVFRGLEAYDLRQLAELYRAFAI